MNKNLDEIVEYRGVTDLVVAEVLSDNNKEGVVYHKRIKKIFYAHQAFYKACSTNFTVSSNNWNDDCILF